MPLWNFPVWFSELLGQFGAKVGQNSGWVFSTSLLVAILFATGLQKLTFLTDTEELFVPHGSVGLRVRYSILFKD